MEDISQEVWDAVVEKGPYVHICYEKYYDEGDVVLRHEDSEGVKFTDTVWQPDLYAKAMGPWRHNPYRYFYVYSALYPEEDDIGSFSFWEMDLDSDYWNLEEVGTSVDSMVELIHFLSVYIPQSHLENNGIEIVNVEEEDDEKA